MLFVLLQGSGGMNAAFSAMQRQKISVETKKRKRDKIRTTLILENRRFSTAFELTERKLPYPIHFSICMDASEHIYVICSFSFFFTFYTSANEEFKERKAKNNLKQTKADIQSEKKRRTVAPIAFNFASCSCASHKSFILFYVCFSCSLRFTSMDFHFHNYTIFKHSSRTATSRLFCTTKSQCNDFGCTTTTIEASDEKKSKIIINKV